MTVMLALAAILFATYVLDVVLGATSGASFLGDVQELLVLFAASVAFVAEILRREARTRSTDQEK
jgi:hypothetical protein